MSIDSAAAGAPRETARLAKLWADIRVWRWAAAVLGTLSLALLVAASIARDPPDFSDISIVAVVRDGERHPVWAIRLARAAHQIAADTLRDEPAPKGVYQLWLLVADQTGPHQLGLLPPSGRKRIAVSPENARLLAGTGELVVTAEPAGGSPNREPTGQPVFRGTLERAG
ncbi:MAG TPA: anti-sigma factor [Stellaceae bacterium]|nr:anti-sigma factor [Stellaceae bacterium]